MRQKSILKGLLVTMIDEEGPKAIINYSKLDENISTKLAIVGMTIFMLGNEDPLFFSERYFKMIGPIPIPHNDHENYDRINSQKKINFEGVAIIFNVKSDRYSIDQRVTKFGRDIIIWFIFDSVNRGKIFKSVKTIEAISFHYLKGIKFESQLNNKRLFHTLFNHLQYHISRKNLEKLI